MSLSVSNAKKSFEKLQHCLMIMGVSAWMTGSKLNPNPSQIKCLQTLASKNLNNSPCLILGRNTNPSALVKNLGVVLDSSPNLENTNPKSIGPASIISANCVEFKKVCQANCSNTGQ